jgi:ABC-type phosphate transport system substrate-binding protein
MMQALASAIVTSAILLTQAVLLARMPAAQAAPPQSPVAIVVHRSNPVENLTFGELRRIFMLDTQTWPGGRRITVVLREKGQRERAEALRILCGMSEAEYDRYVLFQTFRGAVAMGPRSITSADAMRRFVFNAPGAIGYINAAEVDDTTKVLRIDGRLPGEAGYPLQWRVARPTR